MSKMHDLNSKVLLGIVWRHYSGQVKI